MYADLVGSTNMSMTLSVENLVVLIRAFTHEISNVVERYNDYILKYVGDAVISFFPYNIDNKYLICEKSVECAKSIISVINKEINAILYKYDYPELFVKIGIDEGENVVLQYGYDQSSPIDILGYSMNIAAKITSITNPNGVSIGENIYKSLRSKLKSDFQFHELSMHGNEWKYINYGTGRPYTVYTLK
jgi:adenylate cyclase